MKAIAALLVAVPLLAGPLRKHNSRPLQAESDLSILEPWETPIEGFFVRSHHEVPVIDEDRFELIVDGLVENELHLRLKDFKEFPRRTLHAVLECAGNYRGEQTPRVPGIQWGHGAVGNAEWTGVALADILARAKPKREALFARIEGADKPALPSVPTFVRSISIHKLQDPNTLLALEMNREKMPLLHGGPLRLILPGWYGQNWIKWITHITLMKDEDDGFYMKKGYRMPKTPVKPGQAWDSATGDPITELRVQSIIVSPPPNATVSKDFAIDGKAFSGAGTIRSVEYSTDKGKSWKPCDLQKPKPLGGWQDFHAKISSKSSTVTVWTRATDVKGNRQPIASEWNPAGYLRNQVDRRTYLVSRVQSKPAEGESLFKERCLICHSAEMITSQRLSEEAWDKTLKKMVTFGAKFTSEEHQVLKRYLSQFSDKLPSAETTVTDYVTESELVDSTEKIAGRHEKGRALYATHCAVCHGEMGEGKNGPRLLGRMVTAASYWSSLKYGKNSMPSFSASLSTENMADIRAYLRKGE